MNNPALISPYGGALVNLVAAAEQLDELRDRATRLPSIQLSDRALCDLELLACGAFSPLDRFLGQEDYLRVIDEMRLASGHLFPIPVTLPTDQSDGLHLDRDIALRSSRNELLGILTVEEIYEWNVRAVSQKVFGTTDARHPLIAEMEGWGRINLSGRLRLLQLPSHLDSQDLRLTPAAVRRRLEKLGHSNVVAFQTRNPLHRAHEEMTKRAIDQVNGALLLHPVVGMTKPGDVDQFARVRTYRVLAERYYDQKRIVLAILPLAMRLAGPREALWHALIRRNYGANFLIVGRDHASPGNDSRGRPFYEPYAAQELLAQFSQELGVGLIPFRELAYVPTTGRYEENTGSEALTLSGSTIREEYLKRGRPLPEWFTRPEVAQILAENYPPLHRQGVCIWFTGLSGAGKSTTAELLTAKLLETGRRVTLLDGDVVRTHLSKGLGFSKEDRDTNIRRIGFVASEIVRHGGVAVCAAVSPYRATRNEVRSLIGSDQFFEVFVNTPIEVCDQRDTKGIYAKARRGEIESLSGVNDPYEAPESPELVLDTVSRTVAQNVELIMRRLRDAGFVAASDCISTTADAGAKSARE